MVVDLNIFCSYAPKDGEWMDKLQAHLNSEGMRGWYDLKISLGDTWEDTTIAYLRAADIILLLISADFIKSDRCKGEMDHALKRHNKGEACVIPIIIRPVHWKRQPFGKVPVLPSSGKPVASWSSPDDAFVDVVDDISRVAGKILKKKYICKAEEYCEAHRYQEALDAYERAILLPREYADLSDDPSLYEKKGDVLLLKLNRAEDALISYNNAIRLNPNNPQYHASKGNALKNLGEFDKAGEAYKKFTKLVKEEKQLIRRLKNWLKRKKFVGRRRIVAIVSVALTVIVLLGLMFPHYSILLQPPIPTPSPGIPTPESPCTIPAKGIGICPDDSTKGGKQQEDIGLSDGSYALDVGNERPGSNDKKKGSEAFKNQQWSDATALWHQALAEDTSDAEAATYLEDLRVLNSHHPYLTVVVGAVLADSPVDYSSRDQLQGAYVAQHEYNNQAIQRKNGVLLRLLIAKSGNDVNQSALVVRFILKAQEQDKTIVAVLGWTKTAQSSLVLPILDQAHIPLISATATGDTLTDPPSSYFFRVVPPNKVQAAFLASYIESHYTIHRLVAFFDDSDPFSQNFVEDFQQRYGGGGHTFVFEMKDYRALESKNDFTRHVQTILQYNPDAVLLETKASADVGRFLNTLPPSFAKLKIFADASVYPIANAVPGEYKNADALSFVSPAFPDEWGVLGYGSQKPSFIDDYARIFDPTEQHINYSSYGYSRPDAYAMLAYDGVNTLLEAIRRVQTARGEETTRVSAENVQQGLKSITLAAAFQGITGQIAFGLDGDPVDKEVLMLNVMALPGKSPGLNLVAHAGCLVQGTPDCKSGT